MNYPKIMMFLSGFVGLTAFVTFLVLKLAKIWNIAWIIVFTPLMAMIVIWVFIIIIGVMVYSTLGD